MVEQREIVAVAVSAFLNSSDLSPPDHAQGKWMLSNRTEPALGGEVSEETLLDAHGLSDAELRSTLSACLASLHESKNRDQSISAQELPEKTRESVEVVNTADPTDQCDASNTYSDDLFEPYIPDQDSPNDSIDKGGRRATKGDSQNVCWGSMRASPPGLCGDQGEYALVILKISQAVPHAIMRVPYKVAVLLKNENGDWVARSVEAFDSADWAHE